MDAVCTLLEAASLALTFPRSRGQHLVTADQAVVRVRVLLRLAAAQGALTARQLRYASGNLADIGRMIGGWRKRLPSNAGERPPTAAIV